LAKILFGDFNVKYLTRDYNDIFFAALARSRFNIFIEYFTSLNLVDDTGMIFTVVGYGNVPQQGVFFFRQSI
jgi:hypothetical protein